MMSEVKNPQNKSQIIYLWTHDRHHSQRQSSFTHSLTEIEWERFVRRKPQNVITTQGNVCTRCWPCCWVSVPPALLRKPELPHKSAVKLTRLCLQPLEEPIYLV